MTGRKAIVLGCGAVTFLALMVVAAVIGFMVYAAQDVKGMGVTVEAPSEVTVGQSFEVSIVVTNERPRKALSLSDIDLAEEYLAGFALVSTKPPSKSSMHVPIDNSRSFNFGVKIPAKESRTFTFELRAEKPGQYRGDVDVCEGSRFITQLAETTVREK